MSEPQSTALAISRVLLWILIGLNIFGGVVILVGLPSTFIFEDVVRDFFTKRPSAPHADALVWTLRIWGVLGLGMVAAAHVTLTRLLEMIATVREGDPFVPENAVRLKTIAWCLLAIQLLHLLFGIMAKAMNFAGSNIQWNWSGTGWLAVVLTFVLARVFEEGARIRTDLKAMI